MKKRKILSIILLSTMSLALVACGSSSSKSNYADVEAAMGDYGYAAEEPYAVDRYDYSDEMIAYDDAAYEEPAYEESTSVSTSENANTSNRKLIKTVSLGLETKEYDSLLVNLQNNIKNCGGYIQSMDINNGSIYSTSKTSHRNAYLVARIPARSLDDFINTVGEHSNITSRNEFVEDITLSYVDMESHKKMLQEELNRLMEFLDQATTIEEIITIEDRITDVKYQLESMETQLRTYDNQVDYSTVNISISEVVVYTPTPEVELTTAQRIKEGFSNSVKSVLGGLKEFGIGFIIAIPFLIVWAIIIAIIVFIIIGIIKLCAKSSAKRKARAAEKINTLKQPAQTTVKQEVPPADKE